MQILEDKIDPKLIDDDFFDGILFNRMCEEEFIDYLNKRYKNEIKEVCTNYIYRK